MKTFYKKQHYTHIFFCMCIYCVCLQHGESEGQRRIKKRTTNETTFRKNETEKTVKYNTFLCFSMNFTSVD